MAIFRKRFDLKVSVYSRSSCLVALGLALPAVTFAVEFNAEFLNNEGGAPVELKYFENGNSVSPGTYSVDIHLNQIMIRREDVVFSADPETGSVRPIIRMGLLKEIGVDIARLTRDKLIPANLENNTPLNVAELIPGASVEFDVNSLSLLVSIPQLYVQRHSRGYVDPSLWDDGVTALFSNYQANFTRNTNFGQNSDYRYLGLRNGFNLFGWRLRNDSSLSGGTGMRNKFSSNRTYVERDIRALKGTLSLGELYTSAQGDAFESVRMRGVQLQSDIGMLPDNEISYTPVVRGIAETNATVEVSQNGFVIYSTNVPPGAFEITDIYPSGSNGDLEVKIIEADGRQRSFKQSYSYLPVMTRKGNLRYGLAAGEYHNDGQPSVNLLQGSAVYGLSDRVTGFGGLLAVEKYNATNLGLGFNTPLGGLSADVTHSQSRTRRGGRNQGQSLRLLYSKTINATETSFTVVGYRYSTEGYRTLSQHIDDMSDESYLYGSSSSRQKSRIDLTVNQTLFRRSSLYLTAGETTYWNRPGSSRRVQFGFSSGIKRASYSLAVSRTQETGSFGRSDTQFTAAVSIPLGGSARSSQVYANAVSSQHGDSSLNTGISGYLDEANAFNYSAQANYSKDGGNSGSVGLGWDTSKAKLSANYSQGRDNKQINLGASGSVVVHPGGSDLRPAGGGNVRPGGGSGGWRRRPRRLLFGSHRRPWLCRAPLHATLSLQLGEPGYQYPWKRYRDQRQHANGRADPGRRGCQAFLRGVRSAGAVRPEHGVWRKDSLRCTGIRQGRAGRGNGRQPVPFAGVRYRGPGAPVHSLERWLLFSRLSVAAQEQGPDVRTSCAQLPSVLDLKCPRCSRVKSKGEDFSGEHRARGQAAAHSSSIMLNRSGVLPRVSKRSNHCLAANPPAKPVRPPEAPITLWQGATMDSGFRPLAAPTARTALGLPICTAISV